MERPDLDIVTTDSRLVLGGGEVGRFSDYNAFDVDDQRSAILESCFIGGWPAVRLSRLRAIGGWDERMRIAYDWDCWLRLIFAGARAGLVTDAYHDYRVDSGGLTAGRRLALWERVRLLERARTERQLSPRELEVLGRSLRRHRTRAVQSDIEAGLTGTVPRLRLLQHALSGGIDPRARAKSALAAAAPGLARRFVASEPVPEERLRARS
jgi:GT2 family glycosyltransferase